MSLFLSHSFRLAVGSVIACLLAACSDSTAPPKQAAETDIAVVAAEGEAKEGAEDELQELQQLQVGDLKEIRATDKRAVIDYTQKNKRLDQRVGASGGVVGLQPMDTAGLSPAESKALDQARAALAAHLELANVDDAQLVEISAQQWRNSSLGCAQPGEMSAQVMTDGYKVVLVLAGLRHQVHTGRRGGRVCERLQGMLQAPKRALTLSSLPRLQKEAIADLAEQLGVAESEIRPGRVSAGSWRDASLGCPEPGVEYAQVQTGGYFIPLTVNGRTVSYRTDGKRVVGCEDLQPLKAVEK